MGYQNFRFFIEYMVPVIFGFFSRNTALREKKRKMAVRIGPIFNGTKYRAYKGETKKNDSWQSY